MKPSTHRDDVVAASPVHRYTLRMRRYADGKPVWEVTASFMWPWIDHVVSLVALYPLCAQALAFLAAIIEAVAIVGILIPGTPILMAVAGSAAMAGQPMEPFLALALIGAVIGDFVSFWAGKRFSHRLVQFWPFSSRPELMVNAERFFGRYGTASVALCRFVPVLRSTVPLIAGMAGMQPRRFLIANVASALVWAPLHIYPAQFMGLSINQVREGNWSNSLLWGAVILAGCAVAWMAHRAVLHRWR